MHHTSPSAVGIIDVSPLTQSIAKLSPLIVVVAPPLSGIFTSECETTGDSNENCPSALVPTYPPTVSEIALPLHDPQPRHNEVNDVHADVEQDAALVVPHVAVRSAAPKLSPRMVIDGPPHRGAFFSAVQETTGAAVAQGCSNAAVRLSTALCSQVVGDRAHQTGAADAPSNVNAADPVSAKTDVQSKPCFCEDPADAYTIIVVSDVQEVVLPVETNAVCFHGV